MTSPAKKQISEQDVNAAPDEASDVKIADAAFVKESIAPVSSPAKELQDKLDAHFLPMSKKMSSRFVTLLVLFTCLGTWISGIGLYSTL